VEEGEADEAEKSTDGEIDVGVFSQFWFFLCFFVVVEMPGS